ncbi:MAG: YhfC family intramembrane metalloprotease [Planctomycetaceae bacterium]|jgi:uncharacterized membrane protein YhfC|nr:YhfC family intramembrane metalloprotease [Planctomycetaceae bacterium]
MVPVGTIICITIAALLAIGTPDVLFRILRKKYPMKAAPMWIGTAAFIIFVLILEKIVHIVVLRPDESGIALMKRPILYMLYGSFMAGIFEETARFLSFLFLKRKYSGLITSVSYGIGHGGAESILIFGLAMINNLAYCILINAGRLSVLTKNLTGAALEKTNEIVTIFLTANPLTFLVGGFERVVAFSVQISLSVIVWYAVNRKGKLWLFPAAVLLHAIMNFPAGLFQTGNLSLIACESLIFVSAVILGVIAVSLSKKFQKKEQSADVF